MDNIVSAKLDSRYASTLGVWQYDYGQVLRITGTELPPAVEVQFSLDEKSGETLSRVGTTVDGVTEVKIPDELLTHSATSNYRIYAYIYLTDETSGNTKYEIIIPVRVRSKPTSPAEDPETDPDLFRETVVAVNASAERAKMAEQNAKASATEAGKYAASASESAVTAEKTKEDALRKVGEKKREAIEAIQNQEETSVGKITTHTDGEIKRIQNQTAESKGELEQTITNAGVSKEELDESIQTASDTKTALDKSVKLAGTAKTELDTSIREAGTAKTALDESTETAGTVQETLSATVKQAGALDTSLGEEIKTGTQLKTDLTASGEKAVQDIQTAGSEQLGKMQAVAEAFTADREQIANNKEDIGSLKEDLDGVFEKTYSRNLLKYNNLKQGFYLNHKGEVAANSSMAFIEDYLSVDENTYYTLSRYNKENKVYITGANCIVSFYNLEKEFLSYKQIIDENLGKFITPLNCKYIRLSGTAAWFSDELLQLEKGTIPTNYVEYKINMTLSEGAVPDSVENKTVVNHLIVKKDGTGNFIKIQDAINSINDSSKNNRYIIHVYEGEYDLGEDFAESDISNPSFSGIFVPDFVTIKGEGNRDNIILFVELTEYNKMISALNLSNTSALEGITVRETRTRYCIHDDFAKNNISYERSVKNCKFIAIDTYYNSCYGSGCKEGADWKFENCIFDASKCNDSNGKIAFLNHNNINWQYTSSIKFINCKFIGRYVANDNGVITLRTLNTNANNMETNMSLYGCDIGGGIVLKEKSKDVYGGGILFKINGFANKNIEYSIVNTDGKDYSGNINLIN